MVKKILLTMSDELYSKLSEKRKNQGYLTIQELINEILRRNILSLQELKTTKRGRPEKTGFEDYFSKQTKESKKIESGGY